VILLIHLCIKPIRAMVLMQRIALLFSEGEHSTK